MSDTRALHGLDHASRQRISGHLRTYTLCDELGVTLPAPLPALRTRLTSLTTLDLPREPDDPATGLAIDAAATGTINTRTLSKLLSAYDAELRVIRVATRARLDGLARLGGQISEALGDDAASIFDRCAETHASAIAAADNCVGKLGGAVPSDHELMTGDDATRLAWLQLDEAIGKAGRAHELGMSYRGHGYGAVAHDVDGLFGLYANPELGPRKVHYQRDWHVELGSGRVRYVKERTLALRRWLPTPSAQDGAFARWALSEDSGAYPLPAQREALTRAAAHTR